MSNITQNWVNFLVPFSENYSIKLTASAIAKKTKLPQQTVSRILNNLSGENILLYKKNGKNKEFFLKSNSEQMNLIINLIESQKSIDFLIMNSKMGIIINELKKSCDSIIVFGSYASGKQKKDSDLDVAVVDVKDKKEFEKKRKEFPIEINPHFVSRGELVKLLKEKNPLSLEIKNNHLFFGDISGLIEVFKYG